MIPCEEFEELLSAFVDGEATPEEQAKVSEHVKSCKACASLLKLYQDISGELSALPEVPETFRKRVMDQIAALPHEPAKRGRKVFIKPWMATVAAAACLALVLLISPLRGALTPKKDAGGTQGMKLAAVPSAAAPEAAGAGSASAPMAGGADDAYMMSATEAEEGDAAAAPDEPVSCEAPELNPDDTNKQTADRQTHSGSGSGGIMGGIVTADRPTPQEMGSLAPPRFTLGAPETAEDTGAADYYAVITVRGEMPEVLAGVEFTEHSEGYETAEVPVETARALIEAGYETVCGDAANTTALVVYYP